MTTVDIFKAGAHQRLLFWVASFHQVCSSSYRRRCVGQAICFRLKLSEDKDTSNVDVVGPLFAS